MYALIGNCMALNKNKYTNTIYSSIRGVTNMKIAFGKLSPLVYTKHFFFLISNNNIIANAVKMLHLSDRYEVEKTSKKSRDGHCSRFFNF